MRAPWRRSAEGAANPRTTQLRCVVTVFASILLAACTRPGFVATSDGTRVIESQPVGMARVSLEYSNVYLLRGRAAALVDAGSSSDVDATTSALARVGLRPSDLALVILTHGHGDHAGMAAFFQKHGAKVVVGRGDELQTKVGHNDEMKPTSLFARVLKPFVKLAYEPFVPDVLVDEELDLERYGLPGVRVRRMPGHTRGSLVVLVGPREAIVGDQMLGGILGGAFHASSAGEHYYQLDPARNRCNVHSLVDAGIERFHVGHGGPLTRDAVLEWMSSWSETDHPCASGPMTN
jgi:hydroxyacylglutathione hydrolase